LVAPPLTLTRSDIEGGGLHQVAVVTQTGANIVQCDQPFEVTQHAQQQQFAVIQAPQHVGAVPMSQMVAIQQPPVTVQVLPAAQAAASQQQWSHQSGTPREGTAAVLMHCGSSTMPPMDQNSLPLTDGAGGARPPPMDNGVNGGMVNVFSMHEQQESQQQGFLTANLPSRVNTATDDMERLPSLQPLTSDPKLASLTATMEPVIEIPGPQVSYQPLPGIAYDENHKDMAKSPAVLLLLSPALPSVSAGL